MRRTTTYRELDEVRAPANIEKAEVYAGDRGVVVQTFDHPNQAIMVEYTDQEGQTRALVIYSPDLEHLYEVIPESA